MFRFRLTVVIVVSFGFVLLLGIILYWGAKQGSVNFQRNQTAFYTLEKYERLSQDAYRYFKQQMDLLIQAQPTDAADVEAAKRQLYQTMEELRVTVVKPANTYTDSFGFRGKTARIRACCASYRFS